MFAIVNTGLNLKSFIARYLLQKNRVGSLSASYT